ncbi:hypothetical protein [Phytohabitans maris]|uniref:hypothetical protein n=1 Tax=Phytohabitans maris TaxID=3071409 RepID=UPI00280BD2EF|nr:hypothetical protein [Phytohabitans sp. ZYX-F-186]
MRKVKLLRAVVAAILGCAVTVSATAAPARAEEPPADVWAQYWDAAVDLLGSLLDKFSDGVLTPAEIYELVNQVIGAVNGVKADLLARLDNGLVNELRSKAEAAATSVHYLRYDATAAVLLGIVLPAAHSAKSHIDTVSSDGDLNAVGYSMITLYPLLETTEARLKVFDPRTRLVDYRQGLDHLVERMQPHCTETAQPNPGRYTYTCQFDGKTVQGIQYTSGNPTYTINGGPEIPGTLDHGLVRQLTMAGTARELAEKALQVLALRGY